MITNKGPHAANAIYVNTTGYLGPVVNELYTGLPHSSSSPDGALQRFTS